MVVRSLKKHCLVLRSLKHSELVVRSRTSSLKTAEVVRSSTTFLIYIPLISPKSASQTVRVAMKLNVRFSKSGHFQHQRRFSEVPGNLPNTKIFPD